MVGLKQIDGDRGFNDRASNNGTNGKGANDQGATTSQSKPQGEPNPNLISDTAIAIIGMAGRFPGAETIAQYWENLATGQESIHHFSDAELLDAGVPPFMFKQPNYVKATGTIAGRDQFDAAFFGFSPKEAQIIDPQHRLFLEQAWTALEHAGYDPATYPGAIGVYAGVGMNTYLLSSLYPHLMASAELDSYQVLIRNDKDFLPTLVSYKLNLRGPSLSVQTACSTSLVAVHLACQSLLNGESDLVLAGGVTVFANPTGYLYTEGMILSPDGHCRAFDAQAQGTVGGNGVGVVVLKRLAEAIADRDTIHAVIRGSAINNDGDAKVGYTAPSIAGQAAVIAEAQAIAQTPAETITYVEAHGTGTTLGDPIELAALTQAFRQTTLNRQFCAIGSVKTNIGHLDTAAGVASLIKVTLALKHQQIPPSLHFESPNPTIDFANSPFYVNTQLTPWQQQATPRRAGVSSFGIGGTNAHVVLEEAPTIAPTRPADRPSQDKWHLLVLSAKTATALMQMQQNLAAYLKDNPQIRLADVAFTLAQGRQAFKQRRICLAQTVEQTIAALEQPQADEIQTVQSDRVPIVFLFPGQGAQSLHMGQELYEQEPVYRAAIDTCAQHLLPLLGQDIRLWLGGKAQPSVALVDAATIDQTQWAQPLLFAVEYALAQLWLSWGIQPDAMVGHSLGEYVAACVAGVFSLEDGLRLIARRAQLMQQLPEGAMLVIPGTAAEVSQWLPEDLSLAASNGSVCTVSGAVEAIDQLEAQLTEHGHPVTRLKTSHAFHSSLVESMVPAFRQLLAQVSFRAPERPYLSNVTGDWITDSDATDPEYWIRHLRQTVRFGEAIAQLLPQPWLFLEVGPGRTLTALLRRHPDYNHQSLLNSLPAASGAAERQTLLRTLGQLWLQGVTCKWEHLYAESDTEAAPRRLPLPTYPFERQRFWIDPPEGSLVNVSAGLARNPDVSRWFYVPSWKQLPPLPETAPLPAQCWLILLDDVGLGQAIAAYLKANGHDVVTVAHQRRWRQQTDFTIRPDHPEDYRLMLQALNAEQRFPHHVLHLWSFTPLAEQERSLKALPEQDSRGLYALLSLAQAIGKMGQPHPLQISVIVNGIYQVLGTEPLMPTKSTLLSAIKVIPQEYPQLPCRLLEVDRGANQMADVEHWLQPLLRDLQTPTAELPPLEIAYRGTSRWCPTYEPTVLPEPAHQPRLRSRGVYLIVGGLGGIGLTLAESLAQTVQAQLILVSRSPFPPRRDWKNWCLVLAADHPTRRKIERLRAIEACGSRVWIGQADVADLQAMQTLVAEAEEDLGTIQGIIHCAGVADYAGIIQGRKHSDTARVLASKVTGTLVLDRLFHRHKLDFWLFSASLSTILYKTQFGQVGYCAANDFLNTFCEHKTHTTQTLAVSINWTEWEEVGMAVAAREERLKTKARAQEEPEWLLGLTPQEGTAVFARVLCQPQSRIGVSTQDLNFMLLQQAAWTTDKLLESLAQPDSNQPKQSRPDLPSTYVAPQTQLESLIAAQWETYLGIAPIGLEDNFHDLGGDSLMALGLLSQLQKKLSASVPPTALVETPTIRGLVSYLQEHSPDAIAQWQSPIAPTTESSSTPDAIVQLTTPEPIVPLTTPEPMSTNTTDNRQPIVQRQQPIAITPEPSVAQTFLPYASTVNPELSGSQTLIPYPSSFILHPSSPPPLLIKQGTVDQPPLFFIHPIGGGISCYAPLAKQLHPAYGVYGIRAIGLSGEAIPFDDVVLMAERYLQAIQQIQPEGSYRLGGWSMGGIVAYEMSQQLMQQGKKVDGLILIDSPAPIASPRDQAQDFAVFARGLGFSPESAQRFERELDKHPRQLDEALEHLLVEGQQSGLLPSGFEWETLQQLYAVFACHSQALSQYLGLTATQPLPSLLLQAKTSDDRLLGLGRLHTAQQWRSLLGRSLMTYSVPGDHYTIVTEPNVIALASYLNAFLQDIAPLPRAFSTR